MIWSIAGLTPSSTVALSKAILNEAQQRRGHRNEPYLDHYLFSASMELDAKHQFHSIVAEEELSAAIDWRHSSKKD